MNEPLRPACSAALGEALGEALGAALGECFIAAPEPLIAGCLRLRESAAR